MQNILERIRHITALAIPKAVHTREGVEFVFGKAHSATNDAWMISCTHEFSAPATALQLEQTEQALGFSLPNEYREFLAVSNGAKLFCAPRLWLHKTDPNAAHVRFHLFGCSDLVHANAEIFKTFREAYAGDRKYRDCDKLNYMVFCPAEDGNYQAILLDGKQRPVFLLFHELAYRPYRPQDADLNYTIATSFNKWLDLIVESSGWEGRGALTGGL